VNWTCITSVISHLFSVWHRVIKHSACLQWLVLLHVNESSWPDPDWIRILPDPDILGSYRIRIRPAVYKFANFYTHGPSSKFATFCHKKHSSAIVGLSNSKVNFKKQKYRTMESHLFTAWDRYMPTPTASCPLCACCLIVSISRHTTGADDW